jgi:ATP-binding cassette subfamily A (ABC1) protein 3
MAMVAEPPILFLDEPTSGVDPVARRKIWTALNAAIRKGQAIVLTSHRLEYYFLICLYSSYYWN